MIKRYLYQKVIAVFLAVQLVLLGLCYCDTANNYGRLPAFKELSQSYSFPVLKGVKYNRENPLKLEFIIDGADAGKVSPEETQKLIRYFLAGLTCPKNDLWVNLSPYEHDRIVPQALGETDLGYDMLKQDCLLKRLAASLTYPESESGRAYWNAINGVGAAPRGRPGQAQGPAPTNSFNKVWIVPGKAEIYENETTAFITDSNLKAMAEEDYLAANKNNSVGAAPRGRPGQAQGPAPTEAFKTHILPLIEKEVNNGRSFANLRQFYSALILALWFKEKFKNSLYRDFVDQNKITGIDLNDPQAKERVYNRYLAAFKDGVYDLVRKENVSVSRRVTRRYFSGGFDFANLKLARSWDISRHIPPSVRMTALVLCLATFKAASASAAPAQDLPRTPAALAGGKAAQAGEVGDNELLNRYPAAIEYASGVQSIFSHMDYHSPDRFGRNQYLVDALVYLYQTGSLSLQDFPPIFWDDLRDNLGGPDYQGYSAHPDLALSVLIQFARAADKLPGLKAQRDKEFLRQIMVKAGAIAQLRVDLLINKENFLSAVGNACQLLEAGLIEADQIPPSVLGDLISMFRDKTPSLESLRAGPKPGKVIAYSSFSLEEISYKIGVLRKFHLTVSNSHLSQLKFTIQDQLLSRKDALEEVGLTALADLFTSGGETFDLVPASELDRLIRKHYCDDADHLTPVHIGVLGRLVKNKVGGFSLDQWREKIASAIRQDKEFTERPYSDLARQGVVDQNSFPAGYFDSVYSAILAPPAHTKRHSYGPLHHLEVLNGLLEANLLKDVPADVAAKVMAYSRGDDKRFTPLAMEISERLRAMSHPDTHVLQMERDALAGRLKAAIGSDISPAMYYFYTQLWQRLGNDPVAMRLAQDDTIRSLYFLCPRESRDAFFNALVEVVRTLPPGYPTVAGANAAKAILHSAHWRDSSSNLQALTGALRNHFGMLERFSEPEMMAVMFIGNLVAGDVPVGELFKIYDNPAFKETTGHFDWMFRFHIARAMDSYSKRFGVLLDDNTISGLAKILVPIFVKEGEKVILAPGGEVYAILHSDPIFDPVAIEQTFRPYIGPEGKYAFFKGAARKNSALEAIAGINYNPAGVMIYFDTHGGPRQAWMANGRLGKHITNDLEDPRGISDPELISRLLKVAKRTNGDLSFITIVVDDCFSGTFNIMLNNNLVKNLKETFKSLVDSGAITKAPDVVSSNQRDLLAVGNMHEDIRAVEAATQRSPGAAGLTSPGQRALKLKAFLSAEGRALSRYHGDYTGVTTSSYPKSYFGVGTNYLFTVDPSPAGWEALQGLALRAERASEAEEDALDADHVNPPPMLSPWAEQRVDFMGYDAEVTEIESASGGNLQAMVKDLKTGGDRPLLLVPHEAALLTADAQAVVSDSALDQPLVDYFNRLLEGSASGFYVYDAENVRDMFGFSFQSGAYDIKALHKKIVDQPGAQRGIAYFHESMHQWVNQEKIDIVFHNEPGEVYLEIIDKSDKANPQLAGKVMLTNPDAVYLATCDRAGQAKFKYHYLIRALQLQVFKADPELSNFIDGLPRQPVAAPDASPTPTGGLDFSQDKFNLKVHSNAAGSPVSAGKGYDYLFVEDVQVKNISTERLQAFLQQP